jgi:hypothetical protein
MLRYGGQYVNEQAWSESIEFGFCLGLFGNLAGETNGATTYYYGYGDALA